MGACCTWPIAEEQADADPPADGIEDLLAHVEKPDAQYNGNTNDISSSHNETGNDISSTSNVASIAGRGSGAFDRRSRPRRTGPVNF